MGVGLVCVVSVSISFNLTIIDSVVSFININSVSS